MHIDKKGEIVLDTAGYIWLAAAALLAVMEVFVPGGVLGWLAVGAAAAFGVAALGGGTAFQVVGFAAATAVVAAITRPFIKKLHQKPAVPTNADRIIGRRYIVKEEINNAENSGALLCDGVIWSARSCDSQVIEEGAAVEVIRIEGVKAIVRCCEKAD